MIKSASQYPPSMATFASSTQQSNNIGSQYKVSEIKSPSSNNNEFWNAQVDNVWEEKFLSITSKFKSCKNILDERKQQLPSSVTDNSTPHPLLVFEAKACKDVLKKLLMRNSNILSATAQLIDCL